MTLKMDVDVVHIAETILAMIANIVFRDVNQDTGDTTVVHNALKIVTSRPVPKMMGVVIAVYHIGQEITVTIAIQHITEQLVLSYAV